jgi:hypothetical protein
MCGYGMDACLGHDVKESGVFLIDVKTDIAKSWQTICAAATKWAYLICSACELMLEALNHGV